MPRLELTTWLPATVERSFELSLSVDAHTASMADSGERIVGGVSSGVMGLADDVTWRARHFGVWFTMTSRITAHEFPTRFVDEQTSGPFKRWYHEHRFVPEDGGTLMTDVVDFESPVGPVGTAVDALVLRRYMRRLIEQRNAWLRDALAAKE